MLVIFDLDGVIYRGKKVIPQAPKTIERLRKRGHRIYFLTNNSSLSREGFKKRLFHFGIDCRKEEIMTSGYAALLFLKKRKIKGDIFVIGGKGLASTIERAGFRIAKRARHNISCVVVGMDRRFRYHHLYIAQQAILNGALFIATNKDPTYPVEGGVLPGAGVMVSAIKAATSAAPLLIGKPNTRILKEILKDAHVLPGEAILVGDRLETDILLGKRCGVKTALALTGIAKYSDLKTAGKDKKPDYVMKDVSGLLKLKLLKKIT